MTNFVSISEAARITSYNPDYIRQLIRAGKVIAQKTVTVWQVDIDDLWRYRREQEQAQTHGGRRARGTLNGNGG